VYQPWARSGVSYSDYKEDREGRDLRVRSSPLLDEYLVARYKAAVADARSFGLVRKEVDVDSWLDRRFLGRALADLQLEGYWPEFDASGNLKKPAASASR
jgi:sulfonate transport system substrate-binding protein